MTPKIIQNFVQFFAYLGVWGDESPPITPSMLFWTPLRASLNSRPQDIAVDKMVSEHQHKACCADVHLSEWPVSWLRKRYHDSELHQIARSDTAHCGPRAIPQEKITTAVAVVSAC